MEKEKGLFGLDRGRSLGEVKAYCGVFGATSLERAWVAFDIRG